MEIYQNLLRLFEMAHIDNMRVLKALIYAKDDIQPLVEGTTKRRVCAASSLSLISFKLSSRIKVTFCNGKLQFLTSCIHFFHARKKQVSIDVLRRKNVLLLISDLDISQEEISILEQIYNDSRLHPTRQDSQYEIVWLPILDPAVPFIDNMLQKFETLQSGMTWYSIYHPSLIDRQ